jgi:molecular chaperone GrpE
MNEPGYSFNSQSSAMPAEQAGQAEDVASLEFGLVDVIEAFTAMRHEWRGQTKESRAVAESIQSAVNEIQSLPAKLLARTTDQAGHDARPLANLLADTDHQLTRAVNVVRQAESNRLQGDETDARAIREYFGGMNALARWFARPLFAFVMEQRQANKSSTEDPAMEGLELIQARLRRAMKQQQVERLDVLGQVFDASTMNAIGTVAFDEYPAGHVAEQLSPGYLWRGQILQFAEVRVAADTD